MANKEKSQPIEIAKDAGGTFCPPEDIDRVEDLFFVREREGRTVERQLGIRRDRFEKALRYAYQRLRDPNGPKPMQRANASSSRLSLVERKVG